MNPYKFGDQKPDPPQTQNSGAVDAQNGAHNGRSKEAVEGM